MTIPNCRASILNAVSSGVRMGVIIIMAALASISIPMIRNRRFSSSKITMRLLVMLVNTSSSCCGRPEVTTT